MDVRRNGFRRRLKKQRYPQLMTLPGILFMIVFSHVPMYGIVIAFKRYKITRTIGASPWVGTDHFAELFGTPDFPKHHRQHAGHPWRSAPR